MSTPEHPTILFDANPLIVQRTGVGYYTAGLIQSLATANPHHRYVGYYYNFLGRKQPPSTPMAANISYRPIYCFPGPAVNLLRRLNVEVPIELLTLMRADFILYVNFLGQPSLFRTPNAPVIHDLMFYDHPEWGSDKNVRDLNRFIPRVLRRASFVLTVSEFSKQRLHDAYHVPEGDVTVTFIPPVSAHTLPSEKARRIVTKRGISKPYLLFVGTMEPRKNLTSLLTAYSLLPPAVRDQYSLVLAGKIDWKYHETKAALQDLQSAGHDIHYLGYIDNDTRMALYQNARLMVLPAHYEGFGMQILEAMQYGVPSAVSDIPVFHEVAGEHAAYFDHTDPHDIARVITAELQRRPAAAQLRAYVSRQPGWLQVAASVSQRIEQTLQRPQNRASSRQPKGNT